MDTADRGAYGTLRQPWWLIGVAGVLAAFLILAFYTAVAAWVFAYIFKAATGALNASDLRRTGAAFQQMIADPLNALGDF